MTDMTDEENDFEEDEVEMNGGGWENGVCAACGAPVHVREFAGRARYRCGTCGYVSKEEI